jgi:hypothetical protein
LFQTTQNNLVSGWDVAWLVILSGMFGLKSSQFFRATFRSRHQDEVLHAVEVVTDVHSRESSVLSEHTHAPYLHSGGAGAPRSPNNNKQTKHKTQNTTATKTETKQLQYQRTHCQTMNALEFM